MKMLLWRAAKSSSLFLLCHPPGRGNEQGADVDSDAEPDYDLTEVEKEKAGNEKNVLPVSAMA